MNKKLRPSLPIYQARQRLYLFCFIAIVLVIPQIASELSKIKSLSERPIVIVIGNTEVDGFANDVSKGIQRTIKIIGSPSFDVFFININEPSTKNGLIDASRYIEINENSSQIIRDKLIQIISEDHVIAIVSANTSSTVLPVLEIGHTFDIPVFITVSTNKEVLRDFSDISLRLVGSNALQANTIADWCSDLLLKSKDPGRIGIAYDPHLYGAELKKSLSILLNNGNAVPYTIGTTTDISGIISYSSDHNIVGWVIIGYPSQAREFYIKLRSVNLVMPVLFTDGGYGPWFFGHEDSNMYLSFHDVSNSKLQKSLGNYQLTGYERIGHDTLKIIHLTYNSISSPHVKGREFINQAKEIAEQHTLLENELYQEYKYDKASPENALGSYVIFNSSDFSDS